MTSRLLSSLVDTFSRNLQATVPQEDLTFTLVASIPASRSPWFLDEPRAALVAALPTCVVFTQTFEDLPLTSNGKQSKRGKKLSLYLRNA